MGKSSRGVQATPFQFLVSPHFSVEMHHHHQSLGSERATKGDTYPLIFARLYMSRPNRMQERARTLRGPFSKRINAEFIVCPILKTATHSLLMATVCSLYVHSSTWVHVPLVDWIGGSVSRMSRWSQYWFCRLRSPFSVCSVLSTAELGHSRKGHFTWGTKITNKWGSRGLFCEISEAESMKQIWTQLFMVRLLILEKGSDKMRTICRKKEGTRIYVNLTGTDR